MADEPNTLPLNAPQDLTGRVYGRLTVTDFAGHQRQGVKLRSRRMWLCLCVCGAKTTVAANRLQSGKTQSCGCYQRDRTSATQRKHGHSYACGGRQKATVEYTTHSMMKSRCYRPGDKEYKNYGARGIVVCDRWLNGENGMGGFECFLEDMGERPSKKHSIDRRDVNLGYFKDNCRWATQKEQQRNRRNSIFLTINGVTKHIMEWSEESGLTYVTIQRRFYKGCAPDKLLVPSRYANAKPR